MRHTRGVVRRPAVGDRKYRQGFRTGNGGLVHYAVCPFSPDGKFVAAIGDWENKTSIGLYKVKTGDVVFAFKAHKGEVYSLAISRNGQTMASVSKDQTLKLWDLDP